MSKNRAVFCRFLWWKLSNLLHREQRWRSTNLYYHQRRR